MSYKQKIHEIIFEAETREGKLFDIILLIAILCSVLGVMLESVSEIERQYGQIILGFEWLFTILFIDLGFPPMVHSITFVTVSFIFVSLLFSSSR